jgi:hypothetical protein
MGLMSEPSLGSAIEPHPVAHENLFLKNLPWLGLLSGSSQKKQMEHYALIFRTTRTLAPEELKQRAADIQHWVQQVTQMGTTLDPRTLGERWRFSSPLKGVLQKGRATPL